MWICSPPTAFGYVCFYAAGVTGHGEELWSMESSIDLLAYWSIAGGIQAFMCVRSSFLKHFMTISVRDCLLFPTQSSLSAMENPLKFRGILIFAGQNHVIWNTNQFSSLPFARAMKDVALE